MPTTPIRFGDQGRLELGRLEIEKNRGYKKEMALLKRNTGISRRPILARLFHGFKEGFPYDPMHLCLLGWVKHLLLLSTGGHERQNLLAAPELSPESCDSANRSLTSGARGIPAIWGRPPLSFENLSYYKAEDFKHFGLHYGLVLFGGVSCGQDLSYVWRNTSEILAIVFDPTPRRTAVDELRVLVAQTHALFYKVFYNGEESSFTFTPTTHAILHLPEMLRECGPLINVSQFTVERFIGEVGALVKSRRKAEANLFNKTLKLFGLRLSRGGSCHPLPHGEIVNGGSATPLLGKGTLLKDRRSMSMAMKCVSGKLPASASDVNVSSLHAFKRARIGEKSSYFDIETEKQFMKREGKEGNCARQKIWIAAHFVAETESSSRGESDEFALGDPEADVYYGKMKELWDIHYKFKVDGSDEMYKHVTAVAVIDWQKGIRRERRTGVPFVEIGGKNKGTKKGTIRDIDRSIESLPCIKRLVAFFDHDRKRYFLDHEKSLLEKRAGLALRGMIEL